jgi:hypothetical protein
MPNSHGACVHKLEGESLGDIVILACIAILAGPLAYIEPADAFVTCSASFELGKHHGFQQEAAGCRCTGDMPQQKWQCREYILPIPWGVSAGSHIQQSTCTLGCQQPLPGVQQGGGCLPETLAYAMYRRA